MKLARLATHETVSIDHRRLGDIVAELGISGAHNVIGLAVEQIALALVALRDLAVAGDMESAAQQADRLSRLAWQVGFLSLAAVAMDVMATAERHDHPAFAATVARLGRVGNKSLTDVWEMEALSG